MHTGAVETFQPTSSAELDSILGTFSKRIFLPAHLRRNHRDLVYKSNNHYLLTAEEPVTVSVAGGIHRLEPINRLTDEPNTRSSFARVIDLMKESKDWIQLPNLLEGLTVAKRKLESSQIEKLVRRANKHGRQGTVMECLRNVERTSIKIADARIGREVMLGAIMKAMQTNWSEEGVKDSLKYAEKVLEMMEDPRHAAKMITLEDPRARPEIVGVALHLAALKAVRFHEKNDKDGKVRKYTERMLALWENASFETEHLNIHGANHALQLWSPVWRGIEAAQLCLAQDSQLVKKLKDIGLHDLDPFLKKSREILTKESSLERERRGLKIYKSILSSEK